MTTLPALVSLTGVAVASIGLVGLAAPGLLIRRLRSWGALASFPVTLVLRVVFGLVFLMAAPDCRLPAVVRLVGIIELAGAAVLVGLGAGRLARFVEWWLDRPASFIRSWCFAALAFGILLLYSGA